MKLTLAHTTALAASHTPVSPTDTAGTHSHFTHAQAQPHQSTALLRMGKDHHLATQVASGSPLHSAPLQRSRAPPTTAHRRQALTPVWWTCCGHGRCTHAAWSRPQLRCRPAWSWRPTSGVVSGRRLNESVEQRVTSVPLESLLGRNPGAGPRNTPRSRLSRIAGHSRAASWRRTLKKASRWRRAKSADWVYIPTRLGLYPD